MEYKIDNTLMYVSDISQSYYAGWVSIHRKLMNKAFFKKPNYLAVWIYLLLNANHSDNEFIFNNKTVIVKRGSLITSQKGISEYFKISIGTVSRILNYFKTENQIEIKTSNLNTYITIINYDGYQDNGNQNRKPVETKLKPKEKQIETNNNDNKENKENKEIIKEIIDYLNLKSGKKFKDNSKNTISIITARLKEKFTLDDFKKVIDIKSTKWKDDAKMNEYLSPETLFSTKFESYLNETIVISGTDNQPQTTGLKNIAEMEAF